MQTRNEFETVVNIMKATKRIICNKTTQRIYFILCCFLKVTDKSDPCA